MTGPHFSLLHTIVWPISTLQIWPLKEIMYKMKHFSLSGEDGPKYGFCAPL